MLSDTSFKHACFICDNPGEKNNFLIPYIIQGLKSEKKTICFTGTETTEFIRDLTSLVTDDIPLYIKKKKLVVVDTGDVAGKKQKISSGRILTKLAAETRKAISKGMGGVVFVDDMHWLSGMKNPVKILNTHELNLLSMIEQQPVSGICVYDRNTFSNDVLLAALHSHKTIIIGNRAFDNFYYIPPRKKPGLSEENDELVRKTGYLKNFYALNNELEAGNRELKLIIENSPICIGFSRDGITLDANKAYLKLFGYEDISELKGTPLINQIAPQCRADIVNRVNNRIAGDNSPQTYESVGLKKDGSQFPFIISSNRVQLADGLLTLAFFMDLSEKVESSRKLSESIEQFKASFDYSTIGNCQASLDGRLFNVNKAMCDILGYTKEELTGMRFHDFTHPGDIDESILLVRDLLNGQDRTRKLQKRYIHKNGSIVWAYTSIYLHKSSTGENLFFITQLQDITILKNQEYKLKEKNDEIEAQNEEYRQLNEELVKAKTTLESREKNLIEVQKVANLGSYLLDIPSGMWTSSAILDEIFGIDESFVRSVEGWVSIVHESEQQDMLNYFLTDVLAKKGTFDLEYRIRRISDKAERWVHGKGKLAFDASGNPVNMIGTIQDITGRKKSEFMIREKTEEIEAQNEEYLSLNEELSESINKINVINQELAEAKTKAEDADKLKSAFLANMSHEIRTPMNGILGFSGMLSNPDLDKEKQMQFIRIIQDCSNQLLTLIDDLIDIAKIESNQVKIEISSTCLNDVLFEVYSLFKPKTDIAGLELFLSPGLLDSRSYVMTDEIRLKQVLINLMSNAIKFTTKGYVKFGYVILGEFIEFYIEDTGIGIPREYYEIIFDRFRQVGSEGKKRYGGTGLGLSISKSLVSLLGGKIWVESELNKKSVFYFTIPNHTAGENDQVYKRIGTGIKPAFEKLVTILVAEDEQMNFLFFAEIFNNMNVKLLRAVDGEEAIRIFKDNPDIDIVLMDLKMPGINGFDAAREIRKIRKDVCIIAQTAYAQSSDKFKAIQAGCDDYISKPINTIELFRIIHKYTS